MPDAFVDTDVLIRLLTGDDPQKQAEAAPLFGRVESGRLTLAAPETIIADAVSVLPFPRLYHLPRASVRTLLQPLVRLPGFKIRNRRTVLEALDLYLTTNLDFDDALIVASMQREGAQVIYSYDAHFDRIHDIIRRRPGAAPSA